MVICNRTCAISESALCACACVCACVSIYITCGVMVVQKFLLEKIMSRVSEQKVIVLK